MPLNIGHIFLNEKSRILLKKKKHVDCPQTKSFALISGPKFNFHHISTTTGIISNNVVPWREADSESVNKYYPEPSVQQASVQTECDSQTTES